MPEAGLARELGLDYACLALVANWAPGAGPQIDAAITLQDVLDNVGAASSGLPALVTQMLSGWLQPPVILSLRASVRPGDCREAHPHCTQTRWGEKRNHAPGTSETKHRARAY